MRARSTGPPIHVMRARLMSFVLPPLGQPFEFGEELGLDPFARGEQAAHRRVDAGAAGVDAQPGAQGRHLPEADAPDPTGAAAPGPRPCARRPGPRRRSRPCSPGRPAGLARPPHTPRHTTPVARRRAATRIRVSPAGRAMRRPSVRAARPVRAAGRRSRVLPGDPRVPCRRRGVPRPRPVAGAFVPLPMLAPRCCWPVPAPRPGRGGNAIPARVPRGAAVPRSVPARCLQACS